MEISVIVAVVVIEILLLASLIWVDADAWR
jgi:hypothetical protein